MCPETVQLSVSIDWCSVQLSQQLLLLRVMCWVYLPLTLLHCRILEGVESAQSLPRVELREHLYHPTNALTLVQRYHREWNQQVGELVYQDNSHGVCVCGVVGVVWCGVCVHVCICVCVFVCVISNS